MNTSKRVLNISTSLLPSSKTKAIWMWTANRVATDPDKVISTLESNNINEIYVPYDNTKASDSQYKYFIGKCSIKGIEVHALHGDSTWALTINQKAGLDIINSVHTYNLTAEKDERFKAMHFDVEPHGLNGTNGYPNNWNDDKVGTIRQWINNSGVWIGLAKQVKLPIGGAFVFWLNDPTLTPSEYQPKLVSQIMIDMYDYYAIMAYRDTTVAIESISIDQVDYATSAKIIIGIETTQQSPLSITFYDEGFTTAENAIKGVHDNLKDKYGYKGIAIHDFTQWEKFTSSLVVNSSKRVLVPIRTMTTV